MGMKPTSKKAKSKRVPVRLRNKIEKASAAKQRKNKKLAKNNPEWRSRVKKDPGIPNLFPYKDRLLQDIEKQRAFKEEEQARKKEEARLARVGAKKDDADEEDDAAKLSDADSLIDIEDDDNDGEDMDEDEGNDSNPMAALLASAKARAAEYDERMEASDSDSMNEEESLPTSKSKIDPSSRAFSHLFPNVLSTADVILYVLDARDPPSTRSIPTERQIAAYEGGSRRLILILNKIDLVPQKVLHGWLSYLRRYHLTLPLHASPPAPNAKTYDHKALTQKTTSEHLLKALKSYAATQNFKRALTVGVVGFPNVGKSSVINTLVARFGRGSTPAPVGAEAGVTTALRQVKLDKKLILLDSPGVVFPEQEQAAPVAGPNSKQETQARLVLLNALPPKAINDPLPAIQLLLSRLSATPTSLQAMLDYYGLPPLMTTGGDVVTDFLVQVARKRGRLSKGGVPNVTAAAMNVLGDWRDGRITGWVEPPAIPVKSGDVKMGGAVAGDEKGDEKAIVANWAKEFKIEGLWGGPDEESMDVDGQA